MNRKEIIHELQKLYSLKRMYGYKKTATQKEYEILNQIRFKIKFYEAIINSNYHDTIVDYERIRLAVQKIIKQKNCNNKRWKK